MAIDDDDDHSVCEEFDVDWTLGANTCGDSCGQMTCGCRGVQAGVPAAAQHVDMAAGGNEHAIEQEYGDWVFNIVADGQESADIGAIDDDGGIWIKRLHI